MVGLLGNTKLPDDRMYGMFTTTDWIVDTSASNHMTADASLLFDIVCITDCPVSLPNGVVIMAMQEGSVRLSESLTLTHVLFVQVTFRFSTNCDSKCIVQFNFDC